MLGTQQVTDSVIARPNTQRKPEQTERSANYISPDATRYIMAVIQPVKNLDGQFFATETIEANQFFPLRSLESPGWNAAGGSIKVPRSPAEQVADIMQDAANENNPRIIVDFFKLSQLESETDAEQILSALANPKPCTKYPFQLKNRCVTCWRDYLATEAPAKIVAEFSDNPRLYEAAADSLERLHNAFETALARADQSVHTALSNLEDKSKGKSQLYDFDYANIRHAHKETPTLRTSVDGQNQIERLIGALGNALPQQAGVTLEDVKSVVGEALNAKNNELAEKEAEIQKLKEQLERNAATVESAAKCGDTGGLNSKQEPCGNPAKINGRCASHPLQIGENNEQG